MMRYIIPHHPLTVGPDGVLAYPQLSRYYANSVDTRKWQVDATLRQLELASVRATICEIYASPWVNITTDQTMAYLKVLKHLSNHTDSRTLKSQIGLVEHRVLELIDSKASLRLGSCVCSDCGEKKPQFVSEPLKIKNCQSESYIRCKCGAVAMVDTDGHLVGTLTSEFSWITRIQCINVIGSYKAKRLYTESEALSFLGHQNEMAGLSIFQLNPLNRRCNKSVLGVLRAFGERSKAVAELSYYSDKQTAMISHADGLSNKGRITSFLAQVQAFERDLYDKQTQTIENVRRLCQELKDETSLD